MNAFSWSLQFFPLKLASQHSWVCYCWMQSEIPFRSIYTSDSAVHKITVTCESSLKR